MNNLLKEFRLWFGEFLLHIAFTVLPWPNKTYLAVKIIEYFNMCRVSNGK